MTALEAVAPAPCSPDLILPPGFDRLGEAIKIEQEPPRAEPDAALERELAQLKPLSRACLERYLAHRGSDAALRGGS